MSVLDDQVLPSYKVQQNTVILRDLDPATCEEGLRAFFSDNQCPAVASCKSELNNTW